MVYCELPISILFYFVKSHQNAKKTGVVTSTEIYLFICLFIYFVEIRQKKQGFWIGFRRSTLTSCQMVARFF
jgi:hypothetical protein